MNISPHDHYVLDRFFANPGAEHSPMGAMLDRAELYAVRGRVDTAITARPTAESHAVSDGGINDALLAVLGNVSRRLSTLRQVDPLSFRVIEAWFGDGGARHARSKHGRIGAILHLTPTGRAIADRARKRERKPELRARSDAERLDAAASEAADCIPLKAMVNQARVEATALVLRASNAWIGTGHRKR
ncbi:MAG: hypothetical protein RL385_1096 [Pseudomonadota bacterium]